MTSLLLLKGLQRLQGLQGFQGHHGTPGYRCQTELHLVNCKRKDLSLCHLNFWIPISVHPDGKHLWYFKLGLFHLTKSIVWGLRSTTLGFKDLATRKSEFVAKTQFHLVSSLVNLKLDRIIWKRNIKTAISIFPYHKIYWKEKSIISKLFYLLFIQIFLSKYIIQSVKKTME